MIESDHPPGTTARRADRDRAPSRAADPPDAELAGFVALALLTDRLEPGTAARVARALGDPLRGLGRGYAALEPVGEMRRGEARALATFDDWRGVERELACASALGVELLPLGHPHYPEPLAAIYDPPAMLYVLGQLADDDRESIAIVGARRATRYGIEIARSFGRTLAGAGYTIVSGLALGVDGAAHRGALDAGGRTIAVLGCGIDRAYPAQHRGLRDEILRSGAILSELPIGSSPLRPHFPVRNRIVSGLSRAVLVVEAAQRSGSLHTARAGAEQGREVLAVPGSIDSAVSAGPHDLIRQGATLVTRPEHVLAALDPSWTMPPIGTRRDAPPPPPSGGPRPDGRTRSPRREPVLSADAARVLDALAIQARTLEELLDRTSLGVAAIAGVLVELELEGLARRDAAGGYALANPFQARG